MLGSFGSGKSASLLRLTERNLQQGASPAIAGVVYSWFADLLTDEPIAEAGWQKLLPVA